MAVTPLARSERSALDRQTCHHEAPADVKHVSLSLSTTSLLHYWGMDIPRTCQILATVCASTAACAQRVQWNYSMLQEQWFELSHMNTRASHGDCQKSRQSSAEKAHKHTLDILIPVAAHCTGFSDTLVSYNIFMMLIDTSDRVEKHAVGTARTIIDLSLIHISEPTRPY